jgi:ABC-type nitrate/sulfonate/bicarbonate transport system permease component
MRDARGAVLLRLRRPTAGVFAFGLFFVAWEAVRLLAVPDYLLPPPSLVASELVGRWPRVLDAARVTGSEILAGYALAILVSVPLALLIAGSRLVERAIVS